MVIKYHSMRVSIIIPVYNAEGFIKDCLNSVMDQTFPKEETEIVVINDGSTDKTAKILGEIASSRSNLPGPTSFIKVIHQQNQGPAAARTRGLKEAKGEYIFVLSHDCVAAADWVALVIEEFEKDRNIGIVQGKILPEKEINTPIFHCTRLEQFSPHFETAAIAYRAAAMDKAGRYFDQNLSEFGDDADLAWRILEQGYTSKWLNKDTAYHKVLPQPFFKEIKKAWGCQKFPLLVKKHPGLRKYLKFGFVWNGLWRLVPAGFIFQTLKQTRAWKIPLWQKIFIVLPHSFLTDIIGTFALWLGSLRYRIVVI